MKRFEVDYTDPVSGAVSPIDVITVPDGYTAEQYVEDCLHNADTEYCNMLLAGDVVLVPVDE